MSSTKPFRFGVQSRSTGPRASWLETVRRVEALGYDTLMWPDHFVRGLEPVAAMAAAAIATEKLRLSGFVFDNDFRHPVVLAMSAGSIDILSDGRLELGIGAGWLKEEYDQSGIPFDPPSVRIARLEEAVRLLKLLLRGEPTSFTGEFYAVDGLRLPPVPVQKPHPPIVIGGGSRKILSLAAREADIVGITTRALADGSKDAADMTSAATERKIAWVREAAGARFDSLELNTICPTVESPPIARPRRTHRRQSSGHTRGGAGLTSSTAGNGHEIAASLLERRERFGFSYIVVLEPVMEDIAPVVERLSGR